MVVEQPELRPQAAPEVYASLKPLAAVATWIAWALAPGLMLLSMWKGADDLPAWLGPRSPLGYASLLLTFGLIISGGAIRRTPEFWLLVVYWVSVGLVISGLAGWIVVAIGVPSWVMGAILVAGVAAAFAFPIMGVLRLVVQVRRGRGKHP